MYMQYQVTSFSSVLQLTEYKMNFMQRKGGFEVAWVKHIIILCISKHEVLSWAILFEMLCILPWTAV